MSSVSAATASSNPFASVSDKNARRSAFTQLNSALQSGDLSSAQAAYSSLTQAGGGNPNSPFAKALQQIGNALQSGDIGQAQQAMNSLHQQMQSQRAEHHGHHHASGDSNRPEGAIQSKSNILGTTPSALSADTSNVVNAMA